jgi:hypothetical protein
MRSIKKIKRLNQFPTQQIKIRLQETSLGCKVERDIIRQGQRLKSITGVQFQQTERWAFLNDPKILI